MVYMGRNLISETTEGIWTGNCLSPGCRAVELSRLLEAPSRCCRGVVKVFLVRVCSGVRVFWCARARVPQAATGTEKRLAASP